MIINNTTKCINFTIIIFIMLGIFSTFSVAEATGMHKFNKHFKQSLHQHKSQYKHKHKHKHMNHHKHMKNNFLSLKMFGASVMYKKTIPDLKGEAMCFDVDLIDLKSRKIVGTATDCLSDIKPRPNEEGGGVGLVGTTFIHLPEGSLTIRGNISVLPVIESTVTSSGQVISHITGASGSGNGIVEGTGMYAESEGSVRLSGMVDMSGFEMNEGDPMYFDCLFLIDVNLKL